MDSIVIPNRDLKKIKYFSELSPEIREKFLEYLRNFELGTMPKSFINKVSDDLSIPIHNVGDLFSTIMSLVNSKKTIDLNDEDFYNMIFKSLNENDDLPMEATEIVTILKSFLENTNKNIHVTLEALKINSDNARIYMNSKFYSEIRPIFIDDNNEGGVCIHVLKLEYRENSEDKDFYVSLDLDDLNTLKESIQRAEKELAILKSSTSIKIFDFK